MCLALDSAAHQLLQVDCISQSRQRSEAKLCITAIFRLIDKPMNWYAADNRCRRLGGLLLEIDSPEENEAILGEIRKRGFPEQKKQFWMGLTDRGVSDNVDSLNKVLLIKQ